MDRLEEAIVGVAAELVRKVPKGSKTMADVRQRLEVENAKLGEQVAKLIDFLAEGEVASVRQRLMELEALRAGALREIEELDEIEAARNPVTLRQRLSAVREALEAEDLDYTSANAALRQVLAQVYVDWDNGRLDFQWSHGGFSHLHVPKL